MAQHAFSARATPPSWRRVAAACSAEVNSGGEVEAVEEGADRNADRGDRESLSRARVAAVAEGADELSGRNRDVGGESASLVVTRLEPIEAGRARRVRDREHRCEENAGRNPIRAAAIVDVDRLQDVPQRERALCHANRLVRAALEQSADVNDMAEAVDEHRAIHAALRTGDADAVADLIEGHVRSFDAQVRAAVTARLDAPLAGA